MTLLIRFGIASACLVPSLLFFIPVASAEHCTAAKIAIVVGPWESSEGQISYAVQTQDSDGISCHVTETLRLSFQSSGSGTFTGQTGSAVQEWISSNSANRNFYYRQAVGESHVLTVKAGYGPAEGWTMLWEASVTTSETPPEEEETPPASAPSGTASAGSTGIAKVAGTNNKVTSSTVAKARTFADDSLKLTITHAKRVSVGQPTVFVALPSGLEDEELHTLRYLWNFGDGTTGTGRTPSHVYAHPGSYIVMGTVSRQGHEIVIRTEIAVSPRSITVEKDAEGGVTIRNSAPHEVEISRYELSDGARTFVIPDQTYLLPKASITLLPALSGLGVRAPSVFVYDREGILLAQYPVPIEDSGEALADLLEEASILELAVISDEILSDEAESAQSSDVPSEEASATSTRADDEQVIDQRAVASANNVANAGTPSRPLASFGFVGVLLMGVLALYVHRFV